MRIRTYSELRQLETFQERFEYLELRGSVGKPTFGSERILNQVFYTSREWRTLRDDIIVRDNACDLGIPGYEIYSKLIIHHLNPMTVDDVRDGVASILDPEFLITTTLRTHNAIHYGDSRQLPKLHVDRKPGDTTLW